MKKLIFVLMFLTISGFAFAEFQLEAGAGYFFNKDTYESEISRSFNGINLNITTRYLFNDYIGLFLGGDYKKWFSADNSEYVKMFETAGMKTVIDESFGFKLDFNFGAALAYPITNKFRLQSDIGMSATLFGSDTITGTVTFLNQNIKTGIFIDKISSMGFYASLFGAYQITRDGNGYLSFGLKMDRKFTRKESGEVITGGRKESFSETVNKFSGLSITPFVGFLARF